MKSTVYPVISEKISAKSTPRLASNLQFKAEEKRAESSQAAMLLC